MSREPLLSLISNQLIEQFPDPLEALAEPDGLLAAGGDLLASTLIDAYARGIFPWYSEGQPILWWCPSMRSVIKPGAVKISRSMKKTLRRQEMEVSMDTQFENVINSCAAPRTTGANIEPGTWITADMRDAYIQLHHNGYAHSVECNRNGELVGGLYGVAVGSVFFGESMFSKENDASKIALIKLSEQLHAWDYKLIDCQIHNPHLASMGAMEISRAEFLNVLKPLVSRRPADISWQET